MRQPDRVPPPEAPKPDEYRAHIRAGLAAEDWRGPYEWAKSWIGSGGGARKLDPWLAYVASGMLKGEPRTAVHAVDLALRNWIPDQADRAVLRWVRARIVRGPLRDPKSALADLLLAEQSMPRWLADAALADTQACQKAARTSRKGKPAVSEAPDYVGTDTPVETPSEVVAAGAKPELWSDILPLLPDPSRG